MSSSTDLCLVKDINSLNTYGVPQCLQKYSVTLTVGLEATLTIPGTISEKKAYLAIFLRQDGSTIYTAIDQTAAVPAGATFASTTSYLNLAALKVFSGQVIHAISPDATASLNILLYSGIS